MAGPRLEIRKASKSYPGVRALNGVDLLVEPGEVHGLVGGNGAGKSTLMGVASGAVKPDEGEVYLNQTLLTGGPQGARDLGLAIVRQEPSLMPDLSVAENIYLGQAQEKRPAILDINQWAMKQLQRWRADISIDVRARVETLTPEQRFIVEIAKALACSPTILILDEPTEHLVAEDVTRLFEFVRKLTAEGAGVVYISHRIHEVKQISDRITVLRDGVSQGTHLTADVTDTQIVNMIVGRQLEREFPPKGLADENAPLVIDVTDYSGTGFDRVNVSVRAGEIVGFTGIEANGQREFLRALAGLNNGKGTVLIQGKPVTLTNSAYANRAGIGYLPGDRHREGIFAELSVRDNFAIRSTDSDARAGVIDGGHEEARALSAIQQFAVKTPNLDTPVQSLSGGNQQKVVLASVLARDPAVLIVDEPTQGVDVGTRAEIYRTLREVASEGRGVLVVSSDATEIAGLCDRVLIFSRGKVVTELKDDAVTENNITEAVLTATSHRSRHEKRSSAFRNWLAGDVAPIATVALVVVALGLYAGYINPFYFSGRNFAGMLALIATLAFVAYGQQILMLIGSIDLSVGPLMGLIVIVASFYLTDEIPLEYRLIGWLLMLLVAVAAGVVNWALVDIAGLHPMVATLATYMAFQAVSLVLRPIPGGTISYDLIDGIGMTWGFVPFTVIAAILMAFALEFLLFRSPLGLSLRGLGSRTEAARVVGVKPARTRLIAYVGCSLFAGIAAIPMMVQIGAGDPTAGITYTLTSIAAGVIGGAKLFGGRGSFIGALLGATLIVQVNVVTAFLDFDAAAQNYLLSAMIILSVALYSKSRQGVQLA